MIEKEPLPEEIEDLEALEEGEGKEVRWLRTAPGWVISLGLHLLVVFALTFFYIQQYVFVDDSTVSVGIRAPEGPKVSEVEAPKAEEPEKTEEPEETGGERDEFSAQESSDAADAGADAAGDAGGGLHRGRLRSHGDRDGTRGLAPAGRAKEGPGEDERHGQEHPRRAQVARAPPEGGRLLVDDPLPRGVRAPRLHGELYPERVQWQRAVRRRGHEPRPPRLPGSRVPSLEPRFRLRGEPGVRGARRPAREQPDPDLRGSRETRVQVPHPLPGPMGRIGPPVDRHVYNHVLGAAALAEAYGQTGMWLLRAPAEKAIRWIEEARSPGRGWRYGFHGRDTDASVTGWAVLALRSAETAGIAFDRSAFDDVRRWFDRATVSASVEPRLLGRNPGDIPGTWILTGYRSQKDAGNLVSVEGLNEHYHYTPSSSAIMVMSSFLMDGKPGPKAEKLIETILDFPPVAWKPGEKESYRPVDFYYWYHATYALFQATSKEDPRWTRWGEAIKRALIDTQNLKDSEGKCPEGSWEPIDRWSCEGGRVYATAMATLTLQVHYRYPRLVGLEKKERALRVEEKP